MSEYTGNSQIANRPWVWGNDSITTFQSTNGVVVSQLDSPKVTGTSFTGSLPSPVQPIPIQVGTYITIVGGVVTYIGTTPPTTTTTPPPTTSTSSTTTSSTTTTSTSSTTTSSTTTSSTTTTTPPPGYAYTGVDCDGNPVTIYTANSTFNSSDPAFTDDRLTSSFSGYFIYGFITYLYTNGVAAISTCPTTTTTTTSSTTTTTVTSPPTTTTTTAPP